MKRFNKTQIDLERLSKHGIQKQSFEYEKAHTYPLSQPFWHSISRKKLLSGFDRNRISSFWPYIHVPFCHYSCAYCFYEKCIIKDSKNHLIDKYIDCLQKEIAATTDMIGGASLPVHDLYIGGGTPSILSCRQLSNILNLIHKYFILKEDFLGSYEVTPDTITDEKAELLKQGGIDRISMGIQTLNHKCLKNIGRKHSATDVYNKFQMLREKGFSHINIDLIYGFHRQTVKDWKDEVVELLKNIQPDSLTLYYLRYVPGTIISKKISSQKRVLWKILVEMRKTYLDLLLEEGYEMCRPHVFRKPRDEIRRYRGAPGLDKINYGSVIGFGPSAYSHLGFQIGRNKPSINEYIQTIDAHNTAIFEGKRLSLPDRQTRSIVKNLCGAMAYNKKDFEVEFKADVHSVFGEKLKILKDNGLIDETDAELKLTDSGILVDEEIAYFLYPEPYKVKRI